MILISPCSCLSKKSIIIDLSLSVIPSLRKSSQVFLQIYFRFARLSPAPLPTSCSKSFLSLCWTSALLLLLMYPHCSFTYKQGKFLKEYKSGRVTLHKVIHWLCTDWRIKFKPTSVAYKILYAWTALCLLLPSSWTVMLQLHCLFFFFFFNAWTH